MTSEFTDATVPVAPAAGAPAASRVRIGLECRRVVSFVAAYNRRPLLYGLTVSSVDGTRYEDVRVTIGLSSLGVALTEPWRRAVTAIGPVATEWTRSDFLELAIDPNVMLQIRDRRFAEYTVTVAQGDEVLGTLTGRIDLLASDTWAATEPLADSARDLAAFVQMREPALQPVLAEAARLLKSRTGSDALEGYQAVDAGNPERVDAIVAALYDAVAALTIGYINPPPSWDIQGTSGGQNVRLSAEVLRDLLGTCLDTTVLFASLIAAVGLHPVLFLIPAMRSWGTGRARSSGAWTRCGRLRTRTLRSTPALSQSSRRRRSRQVIRSRSHCAKRASVSTMWPRFPRRCGPALGPSTSAQRACRASGRYRRASSQRMAR